MANKVLLLTGTSYSDQETVLKLIIESNANFVKLNQEALFYKVAREISEEYFSKEMKLVNEVTGKQYFNYLDLLFFLQKTDNKNLSTLYSIMNNKSQFANELILYRLYKEYCIEAEKITQSKNCILIENIFNDPFPRRKDIFLDYFKYFGNNFKILQVYTSLKNIILQSEVLNQTFMEYVSSKQTAQCAYEDLINHLNDGKSAPTLGNPLFNFELYPLMFNITKTPDSGDHIFEVVTGEEIKKIYRLSVLETKKILGFIVYKSYPTFYQKASILNEIGASFLYIKDFKDEDKVYITSKRGIFNYQLDIESSSFIEDLNKYIQSLINHTLHGFVKSNSPLQAPVKLTNKTVKNVTLSPQVIQKINTLLSSNRVFFMSSLHDEKLDYFTPDQSLICKVRLEYFFFVRTLEGWSSYILIIQKNAKVVLFHPANLIRDKVNLVFINNLYVSLHKILAKHFFIHTVHLHKNSKKDLLKKVNYLLYDYETSIRSA